MHDASESEVQEEEERRLRIRVQRLRRRLQNERRTIAVGQLFWEADEAKEEESKGEEAPQARYDDFLYESPESELRDSMEESKRSARHSSFDLGIEGEDMQHDSMEGRNSNAVEMDDGGGEENKEDQEEEEAEEEDEGDYFVQGNMFLARARVYDFRRVDLEAEEVAVPHLVA